MKKWLDDSVPADELQLIATTGASPSGLLAPFHDALVPGIRLLNERSFSTRLGNLHEEIAAIIAAEIHANVVRGSNLSGSIPVLTREFITQRIRQLERREDVPDGRAERAQITSHFGDQVTASTTIDLYIRAQDGVEHFFEMKSAKPNKGQCIEMKSRILTAFAIKRASDAHTWWGVPYNPYGTAKYGHTYPTAFFDFDCEVLLGRPFWDFVGGDDTYDELVGLYADVGNEFAGRIRALSQSD